MGGTNGGPIKKQIYDMIDTLSKNDEKIEGIVCSNRENYIKNWIKIELSKLSRHNL